MNARRFRAALSLVLSTLAVVGAPIYYAWRWERNGRLFEAGRIDEDEWVGRQITIPIEAWAIGIAGAVGLLIVGWRRLARRRRRSNGGAISGG